DRGLQGREAREDQVHQDKGIGVEGASREDDGVDDDPHEEDRPEDHDERPTAAKRCDPVGKVLPKSQLLVKFLPDIFGKDLVLLQAVDDFLVEGGQFPDLVLQNLFEVIAPERSEVVEADETVRIEGGYFFLDEIEQRRSDQIAEGTRT